MSHNTFLYRVADHYYQNHADELSSFCFIFPSKRSQMFFQKHLHELALRPMFAPTMTTINEFICSQCSDVKVLDEVPLIFEIYRAYVQVKKKQKEELGEGHCSETKSFEDFLFWGRLIIKDFDKLDRHLVSINDLFINLKDYNELVDHFEYLEDETKELIKNFWKGFTPDAKNPYQRDNQTIENFLSFWDELPQIYHRFNQNLKAQRYAYEGAIYRRVAEERTAYGEQLAQETHKKRYIFVGLFALAEAERLFLKELKERKLAEFVWDEDVQILKEEQNVVRRVLAKDRDLLGQVPLFRHQDSQNFLPQRVQVLKSVSLISQAKALDKVLKKLQLSDEDSAINKAIILPDERVLIPVISSIPENYRNINISMGYPLSATPVAIMIAKWKNLLLISRDGRYYPVDKLSALVNSALLAEFVPQLEALSNLILKEERFYYAQDVLFEKCLGKNKKYLNPKLLDLCKKIIKGQISEEELAEQKTFYQKSDASDYEFISTILQWTLISMLFEAKETASDFLNALISVLEIIYYLSSFSPIKEEKHEEDSAETSLSIAKKLNDFDEEFIHHYIKLSRQLLFFIDSYHEEIRDINLRTVIFFMERLAHNIKIPFEGNPLEGLQILGLLESRTLNFEYLIYLSASEGHLPASSHSSSLVPYTLQIAYGLPKREEEEAIASYQFYQSIAKCKELIFLYGQEDSLGSSNEESRYIKQLRYNYGIDIIEKTIEAIPNYSESPREEIDKASIRSKLTPYLHGESNLSISKLLTYAHCPLNFYYQVVEGAEQEELPSVLSSQRILGDIIHRTMELIYKDFIGKEVSRTYIETFLEDSNSLEIKNIIKTIPEYQKHLALNPTFWNEISFRTIIQNVKALLKYDSLSAPFTYIGSELRYEWHIPIHEGKLQIKFIGAIDRCDLIQDEQGKKYIRILDYKTGSDTIEKINFNCFEAFRTKVFSEEHYKAISQVLFYCLMIQEGTYIGTNSLPLKESDLQQIINGEIPLFPGILSTRQICLSTEDYSPRIDIEVEQKRVVQNFTPEIKAKVMKTITELLEELFDESVPFTANEDQDKCLYCLHR